MAERTGLACARSVRPSVRLHAWKASNSSTSSGRGGAFSPLFRLKKTTTEYSSTPLRLLYRFTPRILLLPLSELELEQSSSSLSSGRTLIPPASGPFPPTGSRQRRRPPCRRGLACASTWTRAATPPSLRCRLFAPTAPPRRLCPYPKRAGRCRSCGGRSGYGGKHGEGFRAQSHQRRSAISSGDRWCPAARKLTAYSDTQVNFFFFLCCSHLI